MKILLTFIVLLWAANVQAGEVRILAVVVDGKIQSASSYYAAGGENPFFENQYKSDYYSRGTAGLGITSKFAGGMQTQEQFEIQNGFGRFLTKAGTGALLNITNEETMMTTGVLNQTAIGFAGRLTPGVVSTKFIADGGLAGSMEAEGKGSLRAGAIKQVDIGTNAPGTGPQRIETMEVHVQFNGQFQVQTGFTFPK